MHKELVFFLKFFGIFSVIAMGAAMYALLKIGEEETAGVVLAFGLMISYIPRVLLVYDKDDRE